MQRPAPRADFLGAYSGALPIRTQSHFVVHSATRASDGRACVVVTPGRQADPARAAERLRRFARLHGAIDHPRVPRVSAEGEVDGVAFVELDVPAIGDGNDLVALLADADTKLSYGAGDGFIYALREALEAAHALPAAAGGPAFLGRMSLGNVLFGEDGRFWLIGFGANVAVERDDGSIDPAVSWVEAPELASGAPASATGDYVALVLFMRSVMPYVELNGAIGRVLMGEIGPEDAELIDCLRWVGERMVGEVPALRATIPEAVAVADRIRAIIGATLDRPGFEKHVAALLQRGEEPARLDDGTPLALTLTVGPDASWITAPEGTRHRLGRSHRRILRALVERHRARAEEPLTMWDLFDAGWPGESPSPEHAANRVYVALTRLRQLGLRDVIERFDDGYRLVPRLVVADAP